MIIRERKFGKPQVEKSIFAIFVKESHCERPLTGGASQSSSYRAMMIITMRIAPIMPDFFFFERNFQRNGASLSLTHLSAVMSIGLFVRNNTKDRPKFGKH